MPVVFFNGQFMQEEEAFVPVTDRGFLFGDGVFSTLKLKEGCVENYARSCNRLKEHCKVLNIQAPSIKEEWIYHLVEKNQAFTGTWRLKMLVTGGKSEELRLPIRSDCNLLITLKPYQERVEPMRLTVHESPFYRPLTRVKTLAYLDRLWLREIGLRRGLDDAIVTTQEGFLLETGFANILWLSGKEIYIPDTSLPLFRGLTLDALLEGAESLGFTVKEVRARIDDIPDEAQIFLCSALLGLHSVSRIDSRFFLRDYSMEKKLLEAYQKVVKKRMLNLKVCAAASR